MTHRFGIAEQAGTYIPNLGYDRDDIYRMFKYLKPAYSFRGDFQYSNIAFEIGARIIEKVTGKSWEENVRERIFDKIGMSDSRTGGRAFAAAANAAVPHDWGFRGDSMISQLESIVETAERFKDAKYAPMSDYSFHSKLWEIAGNSQAEEFEKETYPLVEYADLHFADRLDLNRRRLESARQCPGHRELVDLLHKGEPEPFRKALAAHLKVYELRG